jgi:1-pyrroline-5-carboxylate dehydrogenase
VLAECFRDAGLPDGAFNYVTGPGSTLGQALIDSPEVDGVTFTGSFDVGMRIFRDFSKCRYIRPTILELGGKNPAIVSRNADLERAAIGIMRSAFGLQGQKCSAARGLYERPCDKLFRGWSADRQIVGINRPGRLSRPSRQPPVLQDFKNFTEELSQAGRFLCRGKVLTRANFQSSFAPQPWWPSSPGSPPVEVRDIPQLHHRPGG